MTGFTEEYKKLQVDGSGWSYRSKWGDQMEQSVREIFCNIGKAVSILDVGCGEGRGLVALESMGFDKSKLLGVDISEEKLAVATSRGYLTLNQDFHTLTNIPDNFFHYVYSSHTLEHSYCLKAAFKSLARVCSVTIFFIVPSGETKEEVDKYNPSHTSPIKDINQLSNILVGLKDEKIISHFTLIPKKRMTHEVWGKIDI